MPHFNRQVRAVKKARAAVIERGTAAGMRLKSDEQ